MGASYDEIGTAYSAVRRPDPRIAARIDRVLGGAEAVVCVGAGAGSYEPRKPRTIAVDPSVEMIRQRSAEAAIAVLGRAEQLPFVDGTFDAALAVLTIHHWDDLEAGLREMRRVARRSILLTWDPAAHDRFWLTAEYFPEFIEQDLERFPSMDRIRRTLGEQIRIEPIPIPHDCTDGFLCAYWRRPEAYLSGEIRLGISSFRQAADATLSRGLSELGRDLAEGSWHRRHADIVDLDALDLGYRLVVAS